MTKRKWLGLGVLLLLIMSCGVELPGAIERYRASNSESPQSLALAACDAGWTRINANDSFSFCLPADMERRPGTGTDSYAAQYWGARIQFSFDYGWYSDSLVYYSEKPQYHEEQLVIAGKSAKLISYFEPDEAFGFKAAVYWKDVGQGDQMHLGMWVGCQSEQDRDEGRKILLSTELPAAN